VSQESERASSANRRLREAVSSLRLGEYPHGDLPLDIWVNLARACLIAWVDDAARCCDRIANTVPRLRDHERNAKTIAALEEALWRLDSGREKLEAVFSLAFGLPSLRLYKTGVLFEPNMKQIRLKLKELGKHNESARELSEIGRSLAEHPAIQLRHQLIHQLSPAGSLAALCLIDVAHVREQSIVAWETSQLYAEETLNYGSIADDDRWARATHWVEECLDLLLRSVELLATIVNDLGVLEPPQAVYKQDGTGVVSLTHPSRPIPD